MLFKKKDSHTREPPEEETGPGPLELLTAAASNRAPGIVISTDVGRTCSCVVDGADTSSVRLRLVSQGAIRFLPSSLACVTFNSCGRAHVFLANVKHFSANEERLILHLPKQVAVAEARMAYRVPVLKGAGLEVVIAHGARHFEAAAIDISMNGLAVQVSPDEPTLPVDTRLKVQLKIGEAEATLYGVVRRHRERACGIFFPETMVDGRVQPPEALRRIVREVENHWLRNRHNTT